MSGEPNEKLKGEVREFWNELSCDTQVASAPKFSREYFEEIETFRYLDQPFIHAFAQFARYRDKRILEVGFESRHGFYSMAARRRASVRHRSHAGSFGESDATNRSLSTASARTNHGGRCRTIALFLEQF